MKELDAKIKVCPFRAMWGENRNGDDYYNDGFCITSDCMMWVQTDNECDPWSSTDGASAVQVKPTYYPAGRCGLTHV